MDWYSAETACEELILNGYSDWHLPSKEELNLVYFNLQQVGVPPSSKTSTKKASRGTLPLIMARFTWTTRTAPDPMFGL
jgi:hypothetical protein